MNLKPISSFSVAFLAVASAMIPLHSFGLQNPAEAESRKVVLQPAHRGAAASEQIRLNQLGFYPLAPKKAVVLTTAARDFTLEDSRHKVLFNGTLKPSDKPDLSGKTIFIADFTNFQQTGDYLLNLPEAGLSYPVHIGTDVHAAVAAGSLKAFYLIRASMPITEQYAGKWQRPEGHPDTKVLIHPSAATKEHSAGSTISSPGGWYDAGDYNKYIVNSGISTGTLLSLYEDFPDYMKTVKLNIPESNNQVPDVLDESLWNLRWMLTMQDPEDGGVYHKLTNAKFDGMIMPDKAVAPRYVVQKSTAATLDFAAVMAQASRVFSNYDKQLPGLKDSCLKAAVKAWEWAAANPAALYDQETMNKNFSPEVSTGTYGDNQVADEFIWAASELYISTKDDKYLRSIPLKSAKISIPSWAQVSTLGYYSLLRNKENLTPAGKTAIAGLSKKMVAFADELADPKSQSAYQTVMGRSARDFNWGSSSNAANEGIALLQAYRLAKDKKYMDAALGNLDYLLGRNGTGYSFVSGFGIKPIMHPHHRTSVADGVVDPVPGLLSGGPNPGGQDHVPTSSKVPDQAFVDDDKAYAVNEIAINWNAPFAYLANAIEACKEQSGYLK
jgi:endoglucanase